MQAYFKKANVRKTACHIQRNKITAIKPYFYFKSNGAMLD